MSKAKSVKKVGRGRPAKKIVYPRGRFTRAELAESNPHVCQLSIVNHTNKECVGKDSFLVKLDGVKGKVTSDSGRGRPPEVWIRRSAYDAGQRLSAIKGAKSVSVDIAPKLVAA
jgi:hypothetical protein